MDRKTAARLGCALATLAAAGALVSAQVQLPSNPPKQFGASITPAYEGWFDNPDGSHNFLIGYFSRNTEAELDVPIGPENKIEPGGPDMGQPTHFLSPRRYGMFIITVPKEFAKDGTVYIVKTAFKFGDEFEKALKGNQKLQAEREVYVHADQALPYGDVVQVISGSDKGKRGRVLAVDHARNKVRVEKVRVHKKHLKPGRKGMKTGGIVEQEGFLDASGEPLDLSYAHLRSVSPIHCEYLRNMGVGASM